MFYEMNEGAQHALNVSAAKLGEGHAVFRFQQQCPHTDVVVHLFAMVGALQAQRLKDVDVDRSVIIRSPAGRPVFTEIIPTNEELTCPFGVAHHVVARCNLIAPNPFIELDICSMVRPLLEAPG